MQSGVFVQGLSAFLLLLSFLAEQVFDFIDFLQQELFFGAAMVQDSCMAGMKLTVSVKKTAKGKINMNALVRMANGTKDKNKSVTGTPFVSFCDER